MKKHKFLKILAFVLGVILLFMLTVNVIPPKVNIENNPFVVGENQLPMIAAHRGGKANAPENTMVAFKKAVNESKVDIIEGDIYLTKDEKLVMHHNSYIDKNCDINGDLPYEVIQQVCQDPANRCLIENMTLEELKQYNFGYYFTDAQGNRPYKEIENLEESDLQIVTLEEVFAEFYEKNPELLFILEIKNKGDAGIKACEVFCEILNRYPEYKDNVTMGSSHSEVENEFKTKYPDIIRGASEKSAMKFILTQFFGVNIFDSSSFACLQIPTSYKLKGINVKLDNRSIVKRSHRKNIAVQYWTVNDADEMRRLIEIGCDCIMTDNPELLREVLNEYK